MTENEQKIIKKISDLSGDYKCYDNRINHEESLVLDRLLTEIQQYRAIGTLEEIKKVISFLSNDNDNSVIDDMNVLNAYRSIGTIEEFKALKLKEHNYDNCHNYNCRKKCEKDGYAKAIDEFAERMKKKNYDGKLSCFGWHEFIDKEIDEIAEEMRGGK